MAGRVLASPTLMAMEWDYAHYVLGNFRSSHDYPLRAIRNTLEYRARTVAGNRAVIARRLKRLPSVVEKLKWLKRLTLSELQDIGGCRAIVPRCPDVWRLVRLYEKAGQKNPHRSRPAWVNDYITKPKPDGYRSYHMIYEYHTDSTDPGLSCFNGRRIEIQLRSIYQHAWATALETVAAFTGQDLKRGQGSAAWKRFFALMGSVMALGEGCPTVPDTPTDKNELRAELRSVEAELQAEHALEQIPAATNEGESAWYWRSAVEFLLTLDSESQWLDVKYYTKADVWAGKAADDLLAAERATAGSKSKQVVLVSVDKIANLPKAYPNYYRDLELFLRQLRLALGRPLE